jgi:hypothetical protein
MNIAWRYRLGSATAMLDIGVWVGLGMTFQTFTKALCRSQVHGLSDI